MDRMLSADCLCSRDAVGDGHETADIVGFRVGVLGLAEAIEVAWSLLMKEDNCQYMACANPHSLVTATDDQVFAAALREADLLLPDGAGIIFAGRLLGTQFKERVAGMEFFSGLSAKANAEGGISYFFLGSSEPVLTRIASRMAVDYPSIAIAGILAPPFKDEFDDGDNAAMIETVNAARPDVLWVGMTAPKQEKWIYQNRNRLDVRFIGAIGAVFDFYAGTKKRAPQWVRDMGLEWLPRLLREPKRFWRRNLVSTPCFLFAIISQKLSSRRHRGV